MHAKAARPKQLHALHYRVQATQLHAHLFDVMLTLMPQAQQVRLSLPVWIPGSYMVREFSRHLQGLQAHQGKRPLSVQQISKHCWQLDCAPGQPVTVTWQVYAFDASVRTAWLDTQRGFFNPTSLCLAVIGQEDRPHHLEVLPPPQCNNWRLATALAPLKVRRSGFGTYLAADYDELADSPVEMGLFESTTFTVRGVVHRLVLAGASASVDLPRLRADTRRICQTALEFWHGRERPVLRSYTFMLWAVGEGYGGLEHCHSTALICSRKDLPRLGEATQSEDYRKLLGLISHEYFHAWNVKRLRPGPLARIDYSRENYTDLLWFFEGFTSYYDDLLLRRAGLIDDAAYLALLTKTLQHVLSTPGRQIQSVAQASFDAWIRYYRPDENTPNSTVSYYTKGALVALCLDLRLRAEGHAGGLDAIMRALWQRCAGGPMQEADVLAVLHDHTGRAWNADIQAWVHGTRELPVLDLLQAQGVQVQHEPLPWVEQLGLRVQEGAAGVRIKTVLSGSAAQAAGLAAGDELLAVQLPARRTRTAQAWRVLSLEQLRLHLGPARNCDLLVARDQRLLWQSISLPAARTQPVLRVADTALLRQWLGA